MSLPEQTTETFIAIVMTDIIGSTAFVQKHGASVAAKWFGVHDRMVMSLVTRFNGVWVDASDGTLMYFATVSDAIGFAFEYKKKLRISNFPFKSRIGIHWAKMVISKTAQSMVAGGAKRLDINGVGKNVCARCMSICGADQILLTKDANLKFKEKTRRSSYIPKRAMIALVGLYQFKGVSEPEQIFAIGLTEKSLQPPPNGEKVKRLGGKKKIKTHLRNKSLKELCWWIAKKIAWIEFWIFLYLIFYAIPKSTMTNDLFYYYTGIDLRYLFGPIIKFIENIING